VNLQVKPSRDNVRRISPGERAQVLAGIGVGNTASTILNTSILLLGDGGVSCHELGEVQGVCAEAPLPCIRVREQRFLLDGVCGIASMLRFWGVRPTVWCPLGKGDASILQQTLLQHEGIRHSAFPSQKPQLTRYTRRFFAEGHQLAHVEAEETIAKRSPAENKRGISMLHRQLATARLFCVVDRGSVGLTLDGLAGIIRQAGNWAMPVIYEPRAANALSQCGCDVVKINHNQIRDWFGMSMETEQDALTSAEMVLEETGAQAVVCTGGARGIIVRQRLPRGARSFVIMPKLKKMFDLVSAGDVVTASLAFCLARGRTLLEAACFAATAAELCLDRRHDKHLDIQSILNSNDQSSRPG